MQAVVVSVGFWGRDLRCPTKKSQQLVLVANKISSRSRCTLMRICCGFVMLLVGLFFGLMLGAMWHIHVKCLMEPFLCNFCETELPYYFKRRTSCYSWGWSVLFILILAVWGFVHGCMHYDHRRLCYKVIVLLRICLEDNSTVQIIIVLIWTHHRQFDGSDIKSLTVVENLTETILN